MTLQEALQEARIYARSERQEQFVWQLSDGTWSTTNQCDTELVTLACDMYHVERDGRANHLKV
jgi:hypothetical protein